MTLYSFRQGLGAFFLADGTSAKAELPDLLHALEPRPAHAVFALTAIDFTESEVGAYGELVLSVLVPPFAERGEELPVFGVFPFAVATSTVASAAHAAERWRLPAWPDRLNLRFEAEGAARGVEVFDGDTPVLRLSTTPGRPGGTSTLYQCFTRDGEGLHRVGIRFQGQLHEHQDETGALWLGDHPLADRISAMLADDIPFLEQSMSAGEQHFGALVPHARVTR